MTADINLSQLQESPPFDRQVEEAVLGCMISSPQALELGLGQLKAEDFYCLEHQRIFETMKSMHEEGRAVDPTTLSCKLSKVIEDPSLKVADLVLAPSFRANFPHYLKTLLDLSQRRRAMYNCEKAYTLTLEGGDGWQAQVQEVLESLVDGNGSVESLSLAQFLSLEIPHSEPLIAGEILPKGGVAFIGGQGKSYKTMLALNMGLSLVQGRSFLGQPIARPVRVLYLQQEMSEASLQKRLKVMASGLPQEALERFVLHRLTDTNLKLDQSQGLRELEALIRKEKPEVVFLDPLYKFHNLKENATEEMTRLLDNLDRLRNRYQISLVIAHHLRKPTLGESQSSPIQLRGSSVLFAYGDSYLTLANDRQKRKGYRLLSYELRNAEAPDDVTIRLNPETLWFEVVATKKEGLPQTEILEYIKAQGETPKVKLVEFFKEKASKNTILGRVENLLEARLIDKKQRGRQTWYFCR
ncbi:replicative DNA helicase [Candidatus Hakubella thermalkaliphila]|nr:replicative DNA helicase [Candidatus Hakubella thermalkaliphila]